MKGDKYSCDMELETRETKQPKGALFSKIIYEKNKKNN